MEFFGTDDQHPLGELVSDVQPPVAYPMSADIVPLQNIRWRYVTNYLGGPAVAYDLPARGGRATLYVIPRNVPGLPSIPPSPLSTGGMSAAAWQTGGMLYVLVVEGDTGKFSRYFDQPGPLT
jgi:hypothetical protein